MDPDNSILAKYKALKPKPNLFFFAGGIVFIYLFVKYAFSPLEDFFGAIAFVYMIGFWALFAIKKKIQSRVNLALADYFALLCAVSLPVLFYASTGLIFSAESKQIGFVILIIALLGGGITVFYKNMLGSKIYSDFARNSFVEIVKNPDKHLLPIKFQDAFGQILPLAGMRDLIKLRTDFFIFQCYYNMIMSLREHVRESQMCIVFPAKIINGSHKIVWSRFPLSQIMQSAADPGIESLRKEFFFETNDAENLYKICSLIDQDLLRLASCLDCTTSILGLPISLDITVNNGTFFARFSPRHKKDIEMLSKIFLNVYEALN